jgi:hypothetical protein
MSQDYETAPLEFAVTAPAVNSVFVSNVERVLGQGRVRDDFAQKIREVSDRDLWYPGYETVVNPDVVNTDFQTYVQGHKQDRNPGSAPTRVVTPLGVDPYNLSILDGRHDFAFQDAVRNRVVEAYVADPKLFEFVEANGGTFVGGDPRDKALIVNDKARFTELTGYVVDAPPGQAHTGLNAIASAVQARLARQGKAFVRHTQSGGGFGNRSFSGVSNLEQIKERLAGGHHAMWQHGTALVEEHLDFQHFPSVGFNQGKFSYHGLQITHDGDYVGYWSPTPEWIMPSAELAHIGQQGAEAIGKHSGYYLHANIDMGITTDNDVVGFEINGRMTGSRHAIAIGELLFGTPWQQWAEAGHVVKSVDKFVMSKALDFSSLHGILDDEGLLANVRDPHGVVISIAPHGNVAGIHVQAGNYDDTEALYQEVERLVGDRNANKHDNPLIMAAA